MKVKALIEALQKLDPEAEVFVAVDDEGNGYRQLQYEPATGRVDPNQVYYGRTESFYFDEWSDDDCDIEPGERDDMTKSVCIG